MPNKQFPIAIAVLILLTGLKLLLSSWKASEYLFYLDMLTSIWLLLLFIRLRELFIRPGELLLERIVLLYHLLFISLLLPAYIGQELIPFPYPHAIACAGSALLLLLSFLFIKEQRRIYPVNILLFLFLNLDFLRSFFGNN